MNNALEKRVAELESALLDMVWQFSLNEDSFAHKFMSAEENAYRVLGINYGDSVKETYKKYEERWKEL